VFGCRDHEHSSDRRSSPAQTRRTSGVGQPLENDRADGFTCPCHGSLFDSGGRVLGGPAPRGLDWLELSLAADGSLMVDSGKTVNPGSRFNV
jgi:Rieske Fe-S protein